MTFSEAIQIIADALNATGTVISPNNYDGIIVKKLAVSNTIVGDRSNTNQSHIAITGSQMDIFPYLRSYGYSSGNSEIGESILKKYFIGKIPVDIYASNVEYLSLGNVSGIEFAGSTKRTSTTVIRSKRQVQVDQEQLSILSFDGPDFIRFRRLLGVDTYLIVLKHKESLMYDFFGVVPNRGIDGEARLDELHNHIFLEPTVTPVDVADFQATTQIGGVNRIFYGAPGCGKSRHVADMLRSVGVNSNDTIRVTFHPEYANCDFIGQILPKIIEDDEGNETVTYKFNPGSFTLALLSAYSTTNMVYLIVEEINRGNAAAIFGDMFQLLDRIKDSDAPNYGESEYPVSNPNMQEYLISKVEDDAIKEKISNGVYIPSNLTILATMNSSDQNVFTLDTAFKRRWSFEQISNDIIADADHPYKNWYVPGTDKTWAAFLTGLNNRILEYKLHNQTNEDKRLGKYFVTKDCLTEQPENIADVPDAAMEFAYKVLEYVWNDVCKIGREEWFDTERYRTLEDLINAFVSPRPNDTPLSIFQIDLWR